jgi:hypothetical protein
MTLNYVTNWKARQMHLEARNSGHPDRTACPHRGRLVNGDLLKELAHDRTDPADDFRP